MQRLLRAASSTRPVFARPPFSTRFGSGYRHQLVRTLITQKFTETHETISYDDNTGIGTVYITDHAQSTLGDIVFVQLDETGKEVTKGDPVAAVESVKAASDIYAPVSGEIIENNENLTQNPSLLNKSTQDEGWLFKIKVTQPDELNQLMTEEKYLSTL